MDVKLCLRFLVAISTAISVTINKSVGEFSGHQVGEEQGTEPLARTLAMNKSSGSHCAVHGCTYNRRKLNAALQRQCFIHFPFKRSECGCDPPFTFHLMPSDPVTKWQWLAALQLKNPPKQVYVCSFHFLDKKPTNENPIPRLYLGYDESEFIKQVLDRYTVSSDTTSLSSTTALTAKTKSTHTNCKSQVASRKRKALIDQSTDPFTDRKGIMPHPPPAPPKLRRNMLSLLTQLGDPSSTDHCCHKVEAAEVCDQTHTQVTSNRILSNIVEEKGVAADQLKSDSDSVSQHLEKVLGICGRLVNLGDSLIKDEPEDYD